MPRGDGTGPMGMGPMTGRVAGFCAGYSTPGFARGGGRFGGFCGGGRGRRNMFYATGMPGWMRAASGPVPAAEVEPQADVLRRQAQWIEQSLAAIKQRLTALESASQPK